MYEERFYRRITKPSDLICYEVKIKETDLFCCTRVELGGFIEDRVLFYRNQLEEYIRVKPVFGESLTPLADDPFAPLIVRDMMKASVKLNVGPMATVAGAISEFVGRDISSFSEEFIIENGGDIYMKTLKERVILIYAKESPFSGKVGIKIKPDDKPFGVCTSSGTVGPSLSFGIADAVCVVGASALFADGVATRIGNVVKKRDDISRAIDEGKTFSDITGILIIVGDYIGAWGDIEIVRV
jgi:ApbE superfamily uncharacterized protein (UPF0280 family)